MGKLYLIGTDHKDTIHGPDKLRKLYEDIKPDILLSEISEESVDKLKDICSTIFYKAKEITRDKKKCEGLMALLLEDYLPFEYRTNEEYSHEHGIPHHLIDLHDTRSKRKHIKRAEENMVHFLNLYSRVCDLMDIRDIFRGNHYSKAIKDPQELKQQLEEHMHCEKTFRYEMIITYFMLEGSIGRRDRHMAKRIRKLYSPDKNIAFPVGMLHTLDSWTKRTLYSRIKDLNPERIPLV